MRRTIGIEMRPKKPVDTDALLKKALAQLSKARDALHEVWKDDYRKNSDRLHSYRLQQVRSRIDAAICDLRSEI